MRCLPLLTVTWHVLPGIPADEEEEDDDMRYLPLLTVTWHVLPGIPADEEEEDDDMRDDAADPKLAEGGSLLPQVCVTYRYIPSLTVSSPREAHCRLTRCVSLLTVTCGYVLFLAADASGDECRCAFAVGLLHSSLTVTYRYLARATRQVCFRRGLHRSTCRRCRFWPRCVHPLRIITYRYLHVPPLHAVDVASGPGVCTRYVSLRIVTCISPLYMPSMSLLAQVCAPVTCRYVSLLACPPSTSLVAQLRSP
jgi:hypothetical protein